MDLATRKYNFIMELTTIDESVLEKLEKVLKSNTTQDWYNQLNEDEKAEIEIGIKQADSNEVVGQEEVMKKFAKWH